MKKITLLVLAIVMCVSAFAFTASAAELKFEDVTESNWFYTDVKNAVELGLINGKSETVYAPDDNLTYAEAIKLAACMHQVYMDGVVTLKNGSPWYQTYVDYCIENGIIEKEYEYSEKATRAGYMEIFANALPDKALKAINNVPDNSIPDVPSMRAYADGVYKLYRAGILQGVDAEHNCNPIENIKRSEVATILSRMMDETKRVKFSMGDEEEATEGGTSEEKAEGKEEEKEEKEEEKTEETVPLTIKTQPTNVEDATLDATVDFHVEVEGGKAPYTYQWQCKLTAGASFKDLTATSTGTLSSTGFDTDTVTVPVKGVGSDRYQYQCIITDANGDSVTTNAVSYKIGSASEASSGGKDKFEKTESEELKNEDFEMTIDGVYNVASRGIVLTGYVSAGKVNVGDTVYLNDADGKYVATTTVKAIEMFHKLLDECEKGDKPGINVDLDVDTYKVMDLGGYVLSATKGSSSLGERPSPASRPTTVTRPTVKKELAITSQSNDMSGSIGLFKLEVEVEGGTAPYTYQWQKWTVITSAGRKTQRYTDLLNAEGTVKGATTANLTLSLTELATYKYRCVITDADRNSVTSEVITLTVNSESAGGRVSIPSSGKTGA